MRDVLRLAVHGGDEARSPVAPDESELPALVHYGRTVAAIELLLLLAADLEHDTSTPEATERILAAVRSEMPSASWERLSGPGAPSRDVLVDAFAELSAIAARHLGRPAPRTQLRWGGFAHRL